MAMTLKFENHGGTWQSKFTSEGACVVELERKEQGTVAISVNIKGMKPIPIPTKDLANPYNANVLFAIDVPQGLEITIKSSTEVLTAQYQTE